MANVTNLKKGSGNVLVSSAAPEVIKHEIDIADAVREGLATTEYVTVLDLPADTYIQIKQIEIVESLSLGAGARIDVGDSTDDDEFVTNATTLTAGTNLTLTADVEKTLTSADEIRLKVTGGTIASGIIRFVVEAQDLSRVAPSKEPAYPNL